MELFIPKSYKLEHDELHATLKRATALPGRTGDSAKILAGLMHPHFEKEERLALPLLGLLPALTSGEELNDMRDAIKTSDRLKSELPAMLAEHREIEKAIKNLSNSATVENHPEIISFCNKLKLHAQSEEEVAYPAAILIGDYIKLKLEVEPHHLRSRL